MHLSLPAQKEASTSKYSAAESSRRQPRTASMPNGFAERNWHRGGVARV
jgi:hypothetical protein